MEPENTPLEEEHNLPKHHFSGSMLIFGVCQVGISPWPVTVKKKREMIEIPQPRQSDEVNGLFIAGSPAGYAWLEVEGKNFPGAK